MKSVPIHITNDADIRQVGQIRLDGSRLGVEIIWLKGVQRGVADNVDGVSSHRQIGHTVLGGDGDYFHTWRIPGGGLGVSSASRMVEQRLLSPLPGVTDGGGDLKGVGADHKGLSGAYRSGLGVGRGK